MSQLHWQWIPGQFVPVYTYRNLVGVYFRTVNGYAEYRVFPLSLPADRRIGKNALCIGGLPSQRLSDQLADTVTP